MKLSILVAALTGATSSAFAAPVNLTCHGALHQYLPTTENASIAPTATVVDLDRSSINTPVGRFRIVKIDDSNVFFDGASRGYLINGSLDRNSGQMNIRWLTQEEQGKLDRGLQAQMGGN